MNETGTTAARVLGPNDGDIMGAPEGVRDRVMVGRGDSGGGFALIEHLMAPKALAAPLHLHTREDEYRPSARWLEQALAIAPSRWAPRPVHQDFQ